MISRRDFLIDTPLALLGAALASPGQLFAASAESAASSLLGRNKPAWKVPSSFAELHFLTADPSYTDYRPAIDRTAQHVVFERMHPGSDITKLYILALGDTVPRPFVQDSAEFVTGPSQTRPDWSWVTDKVVLDVAENDNHAPQVLITDADGTPLQNVTNSDEYVYPTWSPDGTQLVVFNSSSGAMPRPCTSLIDLDGHVLIGNMNGQDANHVAMFGGFATPTPTNVNLIAYAGQPNKDDWGPTAHHRGYNQDFNYVFLNAMDENGNFTSAPLERDASIRYFEPSHQGRAPVWSSDGNYVAFESNRAGGYAIFLFNVAEGGAPVQITDASFGTQHAKFFPDGTKLVVTALQHRNHGPRGIAWVDITPYL